MSLRTKNKPPDAVNHGDIVECSFWLHQVTKITLDGKEIHSLKAKRIAKSLDLRVSHFKKLQNGQIIICTTFGYIIGVIRDSTENFRVITFP